MFFFLDEPQILLGKKQKQELGTSESELQTGAVYIPYKEEPVESDYSNEVASFYGYPEEWNHSIGISYELRSRREAAISQITDKDIRAAGKVVENPLIGHIPSREEIEEELHQLLISM